MKEYPKYTGLEAPSLVEDGDVFRRGEGGGTGTSQGGNSKDVQSLGLTMSSGLDAIVPFEMLERNESLWRTLQRHEGTREGQVMGRVQRMVYARIKTALRRTGDLQEEEMSDSLVQRHVRALFKEEGVVAVLGADDPERTAIIKYLEKWSIPHVFAKKSEREVATYNAMEPDNHTEVEEFASRHNAKILLEVECGYKFPRTSRLMTLRFDHHYPGDPGFDQSHEWYHQGSSLGQLMWMMGYHPTRQDLVDMANDHCVWASIQGLCKFVDGDDALFCECLATAERQDRVYGREAVNIAGVLVDRIKKQAGLLRKNYDKEKELLDRWRKLMERFKAEGKKPRQKIRRPTHVKVVVGSSKDEEFVLYVANRIFDMKTQFKEYLVLRHAAYLSRVPTLVPTRNRDGAWGAMAFLASPEQVFILVNYIKRHGGTSFYSPARRYAGAEPNKLPTPWTVWIPEDVGGGSSIQLAPGDVFTHIFDLGGDSQEGESSLFLDSSTWHR